MDRQQTKNIVEAALMCAGQPLEPNDILRVFDEDDRPARKLLDELLVEIGEDFATRSLELKKVASGYRLQVRSQFADWLGRLGGQRVPRYSRALLETLALVAYRQPVTRGEIESVRGVSVSSNIVRTLLERGWVRIVGHRDVPGRPAMLGTTKEFLDYFGLTSLDELPSLAELRDFDSLNVELDFDSPVARLDGTNDDDDGTDDALDEAQRVEAGVDEVGGSPGVAGDDLEAEVTTRESADDEAPVLEPDENPDTDEQPDAGDVLVQADAGDDDSPSESAASPPQRNQG